MRATLIFRHDKPSTQGVKIPSLALRGLETLSDEGSLYSHDGTAIAMLTQALVNPVASLFTVDFHSTPQAQTALKFIRERSAKGLDTHIMPVLADVQQRNGTAISAYLFGFRLTNANEPHKISLQTLPAQPVKARQTQYKWSL
jgi:hypothetical protein